MAAPYGNRNAEKWTFKKAVKLYKDAIKLSEEKEISYLKIGDKAVEVEGYKYDFIGEIARELGTFHNLMTNHLPKRFPSLERLKSVLINNLEANCYYNAKKGNIKEATGIVNLKSNHKWTDRTQTDVDAKMNITNEIDLTKYTDDELRVIAELQRKGGIST
jgi:hypothetical protein